MKKEFTTLKGYSVIVDPRSRLAYAANYIQGFKELFGKSSVRFRMSPFRELVLKDDYWAFDQYSAMIISRNGVRKKLVIDYWDKNIINDQAYQWCDLYAKVNLNRAQTDPATLEKCIPIGPEAAPRIWSYVKTAFMGGINYLRCFRHLGVGFNIYRSGYTWHLRRPRMDAYAPVYSQGEYVYFDSSVWPVKYGAARANEYRAQFIRTCRRMDFDFHGGFLAHIKHPDVEQYRDILTDDFIPLKEYLKRIKRSAFVFHSPSCHDGYGWKLAEFFAMGKAILAIPFDNDMPEPVVHGEHVHFVENQEELESAIKLLLEDKQYRRKLEDGAREYHREYLAPASAVKRIINKLEL